MYFLSCDWDLSKSCPHFHGSLTSHYSYSNVLLLATLSPCDCFVEQGERRIFLMPLELAAVYDWILSWFLCGRKTFIIPVSINNYSSLAIVASRDIKFEWFKKWAVFVGTLQSSCLLVHEIIDISLKVVIHWCWSDFLLHPLFILYK